MWLLTKIIQHCETSGEAVSRFGRRAVGDPRFVHDLRRGRVPRQETIARAVAALASPVTAVRQRPSARTAR